MRRKIRVAWFGRLADERGAREEVFETAARTAGELFFEVPELRKLGGGLDVIRIAVNDEFAGPDQSLNAGDKVVFMPPFSGG
jgi:molybdopterin converting factor small subunit